MTAIYMGCLTCNADYFLLGHLSQFGTLIVNPLIKLDFYSSILVKLDLIWDYYHSNKNNLNAKSVTVIKCANLYYDQPCIYCSEGKERLEIDLECNKQIIETLFNISGNAFKPAQGSLPNKYSREYHKTSCSLAGAQFNGIRYFMFVKPANHKFTGDSMTALLTPFSYIHWAFVVACIFLLAATLHLTGFHMQHALFWIIASIMEQGEYRSEQINNKNKHVIICWLFTAFLFCNLYTTDLYSNLTKKSIAKDLPKSFNELISNNNFPMLSTVTHYSYVKDFVGYDKNLAQRDDYFGTIFRWLHKTSYWFGPGIESNSMIKFIDGDPGVETVQGMEWKNSHVVGVFPFWDRFGLFYEVNNKEDLSAAYFKPFFQAFGGVEMHSNNEASVLVSPLIWYLGYNHFFSRTFFTGIASLQESGISSYHKNNRILMTQRQTLEDYDFKRECVNMKSLNLFGLARTATSDGLKVRSDEIFGCRGYIFQRSAKIEDFVAAWVLFGALLGLASICFAMEIIENKWNIYCLKIISLGKNIHAFMLDIRNQFFAVYKGRKICINICRLRSKQRTQK